MPTELKMRIDNSYSRLYNVAEYFFGIDGCNHLDRVNEAIDHVYSSKEDADIRGGFLRYLQGEKLTFSTGVCELLTCGFGECNEYGYFEFPLPGDFIQTYLAK